MQSSAKPEPTQRRLILVRHAKAVEEDVGGDHARGLSERGRADAAALGGWVAEHKFVPELAVCSTAKRTRETLAALGAAIPTILSDRLYLATAGEMLAQVQNTDDTVKTLMFVAHNPGSHALLAALVGSYAQEADADKLLLKFPTAACAVMDFDVSSWRDVMPESATLTKLRY
jgi:phosphohistidine phosphatase